jgi:hypothetical protein
MTEQTFHFVRHESALDWLRCGWIPRPKILNGTHHGTWSVAMEWICDCRPPFPKQPA